MKKLLLLLVMILLPLVASAHGIEVPNAYGDTIYYNFLGNYKLAVTIEEHSKMGGLGAAVAEVMTETIGMPKLLRCGIHDSFDLACDYDGLLVQNRLTPELLVEDIIGCLK